MSSIRRTSPTMDSSRTRHSRVSQPRHVPRIRPEATSTFTAPLSDIDNYALVSAPQDYCPVIESCWPSMIDTFHPGNDSAYIPAQMVNPAELMNQTWDMMSNTDVESSYTSSSGSSTKSTACISPPMSEAETLSAELYQPTVHAGMDHFPSYKDTLTQPMIWPLTPPTEPWEDVELFSSGKNDQMGFSRLPESAITECEYIGPSKLQFSSAPIRHHQPRPLRSASERSPVTSASGSLKDEPLERTKNNPRNDPRYDAKPDKDGFYHCPFSGTEGCNHQPTKQKCIYAKNLDSHLKPYVCKYGPTDENCRNLRFSSNACLFRHEREMHGLHNHGLNPYLCIFQGCERNRPDNGFPRRWNQRDHMKRVHGWEETDNENQNGSSYPEAPRRRKGPGASNSVPMKRTGSSRVQANCYHGSRTSGAPRYAQVQRGLQAQNIMIPGITDDSFSSYGSQHVVTSSYGPGPVYAQTAY